MKVATELGLERGIVQNEEDMRKIEKSKWKKNIKRLIKEKLEKTSSEKEKNMRKLRHQCDQKYIRKEYLKEMSVTEAGNTIRRRLEMQDIGNNRGKDRKCICGEKETTEHIIECSKVKFKKEIKKGWLKETEDIKKIRKVNRWIEEYIEWRVNKEEN